VRRCLPDPRIRACSFLAKARDSINWEDIVNGGGYLLLLFVTVLGGREGGGGGGGCFGSTTVTDSVDLLHAVNNIMISYSLLTMREQ
jgi:hypothetical protein